MLLVPYNESCPAPMIWGNCLLAAAAAAAAPPLFARHTAATSCCNADNRQQQQDELCALRAIYGDEAVLELEPGLLTVAIPDAATPHRLLLRAHTPEGYPAEQAPVFELQCDRMPDDVISSLAGELQAMYTPGRPRALPWLRSGGQQARN
jgi:hypothetical protein